MHRIKFIGSNRRPEQLRQPRVFFGGLHHSEKVSQLESLKGRKSAPAKPSELHSLTLLSGFVMSTEPPPAPLYLHDLADFLHAHLLTHSPTTSHYEHLRTLYNQFSFSRIHTSFPRTIPQPIYVQHMFQAVLALNPSLLQQLCCTTQTPIPIPARIALLTLLYLTQPTPRQQIRITHESLEKLFQQTASSREAAQLINYLASVHAFRIVPYLLHSPAHAPDNILARPFPPLLKCWRPSLLYGYHVSPHAAMAALNQQFTPACPSTRIARLKSVQTDQLP